MGHALNKAARLEEMLYQYAQRAWTDAEMAAHLGVDRATAYRYRQELTLEYNIYEIGEGRYQVDRGAWITGVRLSLHEALALYLAARRASRQTRIAQPHVAAALEKLSHAL